MASSASTPRHSVEIEEVEDEDRHAGTSNASRVVAESSDSSDEGGEAAGRGATRARSVININGDSSDEEQVATKTDEAERGMT
jgi:hypothetical protein